MCIHISVYKISLALVLVAVVSLPPSETSLEHTGLEPFKEHSPLNHVPPVMAKDINKIIQNSTHDIWVNIWVIYG